MAYSTGTITLTNGSASVTGSGTTFNTSNAVKPGFVLYLASGKSYVIESVQSDTALTLKQAFEGTTGATTDFTIEKVSGGDTAVATNLAALISDYTTVKNEAGAGKFADGTLAAPGIRFTQDEDTGFRRTGSNTFAAVAGGADVMAFGAGGVSGSALMANGTATTAGKIATPGFANLLLNNTDARTILQATGVDSLDALRVSGFFRWTDTTTGRPSTQIAGMVLHLVRLAANGEGRHVQFSFGYQGQLHYRHMADASGNWAAWSEVAFEGADVAFGQLTASRLIIDGAVQWGKKVTIADDAVAAITPPFKGGWMAVSVDSGTDFPQGNMSLLGHIDIGSSLDFKQVYKGSLLDILTNNQDLSVTPGTDGQMTVSLRSNGTVQVNNRTAASRTVDIHLNGAM